MARTAKFDREAAVEVCMNEIWRNGFETCSVKALSEKLGITRSSFYNAFGSREALFFEVLALQNLLIGLSVLSKVVHSEHEVNKHPIYLPAGHQSGLDWTDMPHPSI